MVGPRGLHSTSGTEPLRDSLQGAGNYPGCTPELHLRITIGSMAALIGCPCAGRGHPNDVRRDRVPAADEVCLRIACHVAAGDGKTVWVAVGSPYWDARVVNLDTMCCVSILLHLIASLYYNNNMIVIEDLRGAASLDSVLVAANIACLAVMCGLFAVNLLENKFTVSAVRTISQRMARTVVSLQIELQRNSAGFMQQLQTGQATTVVDLPTFKGAVQDVAPSSLSGTTRFSPAAIEAVYYTLLLMDTDPAVVERHSLSLRLYEKIFSAAPLSMKIVRAPASVSHGSISSTYIREVLLLRIAVRVERPFRSR